MFTRIAFTAMLAVASSAQAAGAEPETTQVYASHHELNYVGQLNGDANRKLFALYDSLQEKPTVLSIRSEGGPVDAGIELGKWVRAHKLDIKVLEFCLSSCANYVFTGAVHKTVSNFAIIGYHGGPRPDEISFDEATQKMFDALPPDRQKAMMADMARFATDMQKTESAYLKSIGVREDITRLGQDDKYQRLYADDPAIVGWTYSLEDFVRFGVRDIAVINPPWRPGKTRKGNSFVQLRLAD